MSSILDDARGHRDRIISVRREINENPEPGFAEEKTASLVERLLDEFGVEHTRTAGTGVVGIIRGGAKTRRKGRCVGLRADMDALPIQDARQGGLRSRVDGFMHACGHDVHTACLLGAAKLLSDRRAGFPGSVKLLFQPAEETDTGGARPMIEAGVLENPRIDVLFGLHVDPECDVGRIKITNGCVNAASDMFDVSFTGTGGHGARPHTATDALHAACQCVVALQSVISRNVNPLEPAVLSIGEFHAGSARNVLPGTARFGGIIRTLDPSTRSTVLRRFGNVVHGMARAMGVTADITMRRGYPTLHNDDRLARFTRDVASDVVGAGNVESGAPSLGVEDFAYFANRRPSCFFGLGVRNEALGIVHPLHSASFDIDEEALPLGAALLAELAFRHLSHAEGARR